MRILITGGSGMLGTAIQEKLRADAHDLTVTDLDTDVEGVVELDIRKWQDVQYSVQETKPDLVLHLAAETDVDRCEKEPDHAFETNALGTENVVWACREYGCPMVYISTGNVFNGEKTEPYIEYDVTGSINEYGKSKLAGEEVVMRNLDRYFIFRAGWMVGGWDIDKKFVYKMVQLSQSHTQLKAVDDKFGTPTFTVDFAKNLMPVVDAQRYGLYHMTNEGSCSRFELAQTIVELMGLKDTVEVLPVSSLEFPLPAPRPRSEMLRNYKLDLMGLNQMPHWKEALKTYLMTNKQHWQKDA